MKSNIALRSNVYINRTRRKTDPDFLAQVLDYEVLSKEYNERKEPSAPLSLLQREILRNSPLVCKMCNNEPELAFGVAIGGSRFLCRCEKTECPRYAACSAADNFERIEREPEDVEPETITQPWDAKPETPTPENVEPETIAQPEVVEPETITQPEAVEPEPPAQAKALTQDEVIYASPDSRVWVNAGPGVGKTYTVVKRLARLLKNDVMEGAILTLCFSKNAVAVIRARLREEIGELVDGFIAEERLIIRTFDSFATYMLSDDLPPGLNYEQRIELFIEKLREQPDSLEDFSYLIVDELQDTVGVRARMLREMLSRMDCGVLLLGDRCQSIYDWSVRDKGDCASADLFRWIEKQGFQTGEMERNHRQTKALERLGAKMRQSLLYGDEEEQERVLDECKACLPTLKEAELPKALTGRGELILCKTNGEAAAISDRFFSGKPFVPHTVMRGKRHKSLAPWIGQILGGYTEIQVEKAAFFAQAEECGVDGIDEKWEALKALDSHPHSAVLYRREALRSLSKLDALPELCLNRPGAGVIVSTVHRAKGSEAECVYWLNSPLVFNNQADDPHAKTDALKASYVAVTRAKTDLRLVEPDTKRYMKPVGENRWIKTGWSYSKKRPFCSGIAMEPDDLDCLSCVSGEDAEADEIQTVLSGMEPGLPLVLYPAQNESQFIFDVFFEGVRIGQTSASFAKALEAGFQETNKNGNTPASISSVYVSALTTVIHPEEPSAGNIYRKSGCWLACELGGFALINYYT